MEDGFVLRQLAVMTAPRWHIITLELSRCGMEGQDAERLAEVLAQCPVLTHLDLSGNGIGAAGAERLAGVLGQCAALAHLNLGYQFTVPELTQDDLAGLDATIACLNAYWR